MILGKFSTEMHGQIDVERMFEHRALTGTESSFFNISRGFAELGHKVDVYYDTPKPIKSCIKLSGADVYHIDNEPGEHYDAYIAINEPDQLRRIPTNVKGLRIVHQYLNDFSYCMPGFEQFVDILAFAAPVHRNRIMQTAPNFPRKKITWIPISINLEISQQFQDLPRIPHSMVWCSSPDRGLHCLLEMFPQIRKAIPDATLKIYYRFDPWYEDVKNSSSESGVRARYIGKCLEKLGRNGENGVTVVGPVPNMQMAKVLAQTEIFPYTCDCMSFSEGFSVSTMDACAAGAIPIIADTDAIGDIYADTAVILPPKPLQHIAKWVTTITDLMNDNPARLQIIKRTRKFAASFSRQLIAKQWEKLILENLDRKDNPTFDHIPSSITEYVSRQNPASSNNRYKTDNTSPKPQSNEPPESESLTRDLRDALPLMNLSQWVISGCACRPSDQSCNICNRRRAFVGKHIGR